MAAGSSRATLLISVIAILALLVLVVWGAVSLVPAVSAFVAGTFAPGLGLRTSAIIAAVVAFGALIVLTFAAGDGLLGEIQFVIPGFFLFFLFFWLMTAWVF